MTTVSTIDGLTVLAKRRIEKQKQEKAVDDRPVFVIFHENYTVMHPEAGKSKMLEFKEDPDPQPVPYQLIDDIIKKVDARIISNNRLADAEETEVKKLSEQSSHQDTTSPEDHTSASLTSEKDTDEQS